MKNPNYKTVANRIKLLAHPERLCILDALRRRSECVCHLEALLGRPQPYVSQQLGLLRKAGIIEDEKDGLNVYYRLIDTEITAWLNQVLGKVEGEHSEATYYKQIISCPCPKCNTETKMSSIPVLD